MGEQWVIDNKTNIIREGGIASYKKLKGGQMVRTIGNIPKGYYRFMEKHYTPEEIETLKANVKARGEKHEEAMLQQLRERGISVKEKDWILQLPLKMVASLDAYYKKYGETPDVKKQKELINIHREEMKKLDEDWKILHGFKKPRNLQNNLIDEFNQQEQRKNWEERTEKVPF